MSSLNAAEGVCVSHGYGTKSPLGCRNATSSWSVGKTVSAWASRASQNTLVIHLHFYRYIIPAGQEGIFHNCVSVLYYRQYCAVTKHCHNIL